MPRTVLDCLVERFPAAKRQTFKRMLEAGRLTINGKRARTLKQIVGDDDDLQVGDHAERPARADASLPFAIVYEDADVLVIDKPPGLLASTVARERRPTALAAVERYLAAIDPAARVGLIHRLDRDASGLLVFTKNDPAYRSLKAQFFDHSVGRVYTAVVHGRPNPPAGRIESRLVEYADGTVHSTRVPGKGQQAITDFETISTLGKQTLLRVKLHTGRKHQIRVHLAEKQHPLVNDRVYGEKKPTGNLMLAATELAFNHPRTEKRVCFKIEPDFAVDH